MIRGEAEEDRDGEGSNGFGDGFSESRPMNPKSPSRRSAPSSPRKETSSADPLAGEIIMLNSETIRRPPQPTSMLGLLSHPQTTSNLSTTPSLQTPSSSPPLPKDVRADVIDGIDEIMDELEIADDQIAASAPEHVHANDVVFAHGTSRTVQKFLLKAAASISSRAIPAGGAKFTILHAADSPDPSLTLTTTAPSTDDDLGTFRFTKPLLDARVVVVRVPTVAAFALMPRAHRVLLAPRAVLADGGLICSAGARSVAQAARAHRRPVLALAGVFKLSPGYPFDVDALIEYGGVGELDEVEVDGRAASGGFIKVENPLDEHVPADLVDLFVTNL